MTRSALGGGRRVAPSVITRWEPTQRPAHATAEARVLSVIDAHWAKLKGAVPNADRHLAPSPLLEEMSRVLRGASEISCDLGRSRVLRGASDISCDLARYRVLRGAQRHVRCLHHAATAGAFRTMAAACVHEPARDSLLSTRGKAQRAPARVHEHQARELLVLALRTRSREITRNLGGASEVLTLRPGATRRRE